MDSSSSFAATIQADLKSATSSSNCRRRTIRPPVPVRAERLLPVNPKELYAIGQVRVQAENGGVAVQTAAESGPWSGFITHFAPLPDITPEEWKNGLARI